MVIHSPKPRPVTTGFWAFEDQSERLIEVEAHAASTVHTRWPALDRWHRGLVERGVDWLLNAAGAGAGTPGRGTAGGLSRFTP